MKTTPVTPTDLARSIIAVPPLAWTADGKLAAEENARLIRHLEAGGISTFMYGGNANFYHLGLADYAVALEMLSGLAGARTWVLPAAGPDFGKLMDQVTVLREHSFPTVMVLPMAATATGAGVMTGVRRFAEALGRPVVLYPKFENYLSPIEVAALVSDEIVVGIKYAIVRADPAVDPFLSRLVDLVDRNLIISGIGERPALVHVRQFRLLSLTSGSCAVAPRGSAAMLRALQQGRDDEAAAIRERYLPLEDLRDSINPIRVLHDAVALAGIAATGPLQPMLSNLDDGDRERVANAARTLLAGEKDFA